MQSFVAILVICLSAIQLASLQTIDPSTIDPITRQTWCTDQTASCPLICDQSPTGTGPPLDNNCNATDLTFSCVCSDGTTPNASEYSETIPYFECTQSNQLCVAACDPSNSACQSACRTNFPCGAQNPTRINATVSTTTTTTSGSSPTGSFGSANSASSSASTVNPADYTGFAAPASTSSSAAMANTKSPSFLLGVTEAYGLAVLLGSFFAGFALVL